MKNAGSFPGRRRSPRARERGHGSSRESRKRLPAGDGALQTTQGKSQTPAPDLSFEGVNNLCGCYPPDTNGDVGANHYMQWVNTSYAVYDKNTGAQIQAPRTGNTLFTGVPVCSTTNSGDPVTIYDQFAHRWVASQFGPTGNPPYYQCVAVSTTDDATGTWCAYGFNVHNTKFNDYPKIGVWPSQHAYMMTANQFVLGAAFGGVGVWAFERDQMLQCHTARFVYQDMEALQPYLSTTLPADADGNTPPPANAPAPLVSINQDGSGLPQDQIQIWNATVDWGDSVDHGRAQHGRPGGALRREPLRLQQLHSAAGTSVKLQTLSDRIMYRAQYRNFGTWPTIVTSHSVDVGSDRAGVRWYNIQNTGSGWSMRDQGTYAPSDGLNRWMPSAAMDKSGDIAVGYSVANSTTFPGIRYAGRLATDPPGTLGTEQTIIDGSGSQTGPVGRWGDYSNMAIDPTDDCTFFYTQEYIQTTGADQLADEGRQVHVPVLRPTAWPAAASAPTSPPPPPPPPPAVTTQHRDRQPRSSRAPRTSVSTATIAGATSRSRSRSPSTARASLRPMSTRTESSTSAARISGGRMDACRLRTRARRSCSTGMTC